jgi:hypothetical protein
MWTYNKKDKMQPTSSSKTGLTRRTVEGKAPLEDILGRKEKKQDSRDAVEFSHDQSTIERRAQ